MVEAWLTHQRRDEFWRQGSVCEDYSGHRGARVRGGRLGRRLLERRPALGRGIARAEEGADRAVVARFSAGWEPGPAIGFLQECLRWFDHWLKGIDTKTMDEPALRAWMQDAVPPSTHYAERRGAG